MRDAAAMASTDTLSQAVGPCRPSAAGLPKARPRDGVLTEARRRHVQPAWLELGFGVEPRMAVPDTADRRPVNSSVAAG